MIGSGPIVIGQAAEFDYSGSQACKALREEGYRVVLVNSNPATIMTDPETADVVYVEPLEVDVLAEIVRAQRPQGLLATMGGQTGLNLSVALHATGVLDEVGVRFLGTPLQAIVRGEDRDAFRDLMASIDEPIPTSVAVRNVEVARNFVTEVGFPVILRAAYTLGGTGSGVAHNTADLEAMLPAALEQSPIGQVLVEEAILGVGGWGEFEMEVMRDRHDNCIIICPMENFDPMGYHTGESIVVAPTQTLNDADFQTLRTSAIKIIRALGVEGGCNIQFALNYHTGEYRVIEVNPRVSRSSALASKATGYPIARIAAKIAVGLTLDEIPNDVTGRTKACFEPTIDYVVVKIPRWPFDKFRTADPTIGTQMKSTGETMAIGRTFEEAFQKAIRSLEVKRLGYGCDGRDSPVRDRASLECLLRTPTHERIFHIRDAFDLSMNVDEIHELTGINEWFLWKLYDLYAAAGGVRRDPASVREAKRKGFSDPQIARLLETSDDEVRRYRLSHGILPTYKMVDTCAAEFAAETPYFYSTYEDEDEGLTGGKEKVIVIGGGPIRIGQGIEFDYCCVHSALALKEAGFESIMINNNPETVSTDYDTSSKLYFEPLTVEDVLNVIDREKPLGVILQFGGQTSVNLAMPLHRAGVPILGTQPEQIDVVEDREKFAHLLNELNIPQAAYGIARSVGEALDIVKKIGLPVLVRPSYVLGGRAMEIVEDEERLVSFIEEALTASEEHPILIDKYLENAVELDVDALSDGESVFVAAIMEHIEEAGVHSGDSACVIPPQSIGSDVKARVVDFTERVARALGVVGLINIQYAVAGGTVYILEANPRASRTVPFVSKTLGLPLAKIATRLMLGERLEEMGLTAYREPPFVAVKESVFPFVKLLGLDTLLSPEMKSTGEVMGVAETFGRAFYKAQVAAQVRLPLEGRVLFQIGHEKDGERAAFLAREFQQLGFELLCTRRMAERLAARGTSATTIAESLDAPEVLGSVAQRQIDLIVFVAGSGQAGREGYRLRRASVEHRVPYVTTLNALEASLRAIQAMTQGSMNVLPLQEYHRLLARISHQRS